jgi:hypothetical protein
VLLLFEQFEIHETLESVRHTRGPRREIVSSKTGDGTDLNTDLTHQMEIFRRALN